MPERTIQFYSTGHAYLAANSLDQDDCLALSDTVEGLAPEWSVEIHIDPVGETSLMIIPPNVDDAIGPMLIVHKVASMFLLDQFRWDSYDNIGEYTTLDRVHGAIKNALLSVPTASHELPTLH
jgi:hypothetical protein